MKRPLSRLQHRLTDRALFHVRSLRRRIGGQDPIFFCLNSGRCGSASLVRMLQASGVPNCYHELAPDLHRLGIDYFEQRISAEKAAAEIRKTRAGVFFEANNRLFSLTGPIRSAFPQARFVFLHRDGRDVVRSGLQRKWYQDSDRFGKIRFGAGSVGSCFTKTCRYWSDVNQQIIGDLRAFGCDYTSLRFEDLVHGRGLEQLEDFLEVPLASDAKFPAANQTPTWSVPAYDEWTGQWQHEFNDICGPVMRLLGYESTSRMAPCDCARDAGKPNRN